MKEHKNGKVILQYAAGLLALGLSVALAWFLPGWYSGWRDQQYLSRATLSSREEIEFLDAASLEMAGRMELLGQARQIDWRWEDLPIWTEYDVMERLSFLQAEVKRWKEAGVVPESVFPSADTVEDYYGNTSVEDYYFLQVTVDGKTLPICLMLLHDALDDSSLLAITDAQKDILYYLSLRGYSMQEEMARLLGFGGLEDMVNIMAGGEETKLQEDYESYDFASVCHAQEAVITGRPGELNFQVELDYGSFQGYGGRMVVGGPAGFGLAIFLGTDRWIELLQEAIEKLEYYPTESMYEMQYTTEGWQTQVASELFGMEMLSPEAFGMEAEAFDEGNSEDIPEKPVG